MTSENCMSDLKHLDDGIANDLRSSSTNKKRLRVSGHVVNNILWTSAEAHWKVRGLTHIIVNAVRIPA